jgi:2-hydroxychromene-2-carboxylate isomerase
VFIPVHLWLRFAMRVVSYSIYHSANSYLGIILAERALRELNVVVERRPLCVPKDRGLLVAHLAGGSEGRGRGSYHREDCERWARRYGIDFRPVAPEVFAARAQTWLASPLAREELPARAYYGAVGSGREDALDRAFFRASYVDQLDVNEESVVSALAAEVGLDPDETLARARSQETKDSLDAALAGYDRDHCPGLPTWVVAGERYWGKDRVDWLADRVRELLAAG